MEGHSRCMDFESKKQISNVIKCYSKKNYTEKLCIYINLIDILQTFFV